MVDLARRWGEAAGGHVPRRTSAVGACDGECGFQSEGIRRAHTEFPNLSPGARSDVLSYAIDLNAQNDTSTGSVTRSTDWSPVFCFQAARMASILSRFSCVSG